MKRLSFKLVAISSLMLLIQAIHADVFVETLTDIVSIDALEIGPDGNIYSSNYSTTQGFVYRTTPAGISTVVVNAGPNGPAGIAFDGDSNMYVAMYNAGVVVRYHPDGTEDVFAENVREPIGLDWDSSNNLYVSNYAGDATVTKISPDGTSENFAKINALIDVSSLCLDDADNVYVSSYRTGDIYKITQSGDISLFAETGVPGIGFIRYDRLNNKFYATAVEANALLEIDIEGNPTILLDSPTPGRQDGPIEIASMERSIGLAIQDDGKRIYFASAEQIRSYVIADPQVDQLAPYFTSNPITSATQGTAYSYTFEFADPNDDALTLTTSALPTWLSFDGTDTISGTAGNSDAGRSYSISGTVSDGMTSRTQNFDLAVAALPPPPRPEPEQTSSGGGSSERLILILLLMILLGRLARYLWLTYCRKE